MASILSFFVGLFSAIKILWAAWKQVAPTDQQKIDREKAKTDKEEEEFKKSGKGGNLEI